MSARAVPSSARAATRRSAPIVRRLGRDGAVALFVLVAVVVAVVVGPAVWSADPDATRLTAKFAPFSREAPLGRDEFGRDILGRLLHGGRLSLSGALVVLAGSAGLGLLVGALAGVLGGRVDAALGRLIDAMIALPRLVVALGIVGVLGKSFANLLLALILTGWPWYARIYRGFVLREVRQEYVLAAGALGASRWRILRRHIGPNIAGPALVLATVNLGNTLLSLAALSFLGLGVQPPQAEWGAMVNAARSYFQSEPWLIAAPGLAISVVVLAVNILGDSLRDLTDPRGRS